MGFYVPLYFLFIGAVIENTHCLTCDEMIDFSKEKNISLTSLQTMQSKEIITCLVQLGKDPLPASEANYIWKSIKAYYGNVANIPEGVLSTLRWVTPAISAEDYYNITLDNVEVIQNFGLDYQLNEAQLAGIADRVRECFKEPEDFTSYDLKVLGQILCAFNRSEIERIHPQAYKKAFVDIGELKRCNVEVLTGFFHLAIQKSAFGPPDYWNKAILSSIGALRDYLPQKVQDKVVKTNRANPKRLHTSVP